MGFAVVHMMKIGKGGVRGIQSHNQREKESRKNPDIDKTRSDQNYDILNPSNINYNRAIKDRIENFATGTKTVRKDAVVLCNFVVTSDENTMKAMTPQEQKAFFEDSTKFFMNRYGAENVVNATVHMDETTPHMHIGVVPITGERLSAKALFTKIELKTLQTDFVREVGEKYGLERGKEGSDRTHLSEERFKLETAKTKTIELEAKSVSLEEQTGLLQDKYESLKKDLEAKYKNVKNLSDSLSKLEDHAKGVLGKLDKIEAKKGLFSDKLTISEQDYSVLVNLAKSGEGKALENLQLKSKIGELERKLNKNGLDEEITKTKLKRLGELEGKYLDLQRKYKNLNHTFERVEKVLDKMDLTDKVNSELKAMKIAEKAKSFDMSR